MLNRYTYDHAIRTVGVRVALASTPKELEHALSHRTAMVSMSGEPRGELSLEETVAIAHKRDVPVLVDAAAHYPESPDPYLSRGADLIAYSGGKMYRGPQCSGFLFGRKDLVHAAWLNGAPHHSFGRAMKVGKEEIMGALAAVEARYARRSYDKEVKMWSAWLNRVARQIEQAPGVRARQLLPTPSYERRRASGRDGRRSAIRRFPEPPPPKKKHMAFPAADLTGRWEAELKFVKGGAKHIFYLEVDGNDIRGTHHGRNSITGVKGHIDGDHVELESEFRYQGSRMHYTFTGRTRNNELAGDFHLGEYGQATWRAWRTT